MYFPLLVLLALSVAFAVVYTSRQWNFQRGERTTFREVLFFTLATGALFCLFLYSLNPPPPPSPPRF